MAYNYQKEKRAWIIWKEAEEKQLRNLGVDCRGRAVLS